MDYDWKNGKTTREVYEPSPFLNPLDQSRLSNHLGFNGFVETSDGKIIFVKRSGVLSIGKNTLADSIGASMKVKYCYDDERHLTTEGIYNAIKEEIYDELKIHLDDSIHLTETIFAFYRDLVEGGKPQFLFYLKLEKLTSQQFLDHFYEEQRQHKDKGNAEKRVETDGNRFEFFSIDELKNSTILRKHCQNCSKAVAARRNTHRRNY